MWLTNRAVMVQEDNDNHYEILSNELYLDRDTIYLAPRGYITDNYTIPFGINKEKYDVRPSHIHDIGCEFHQLIKVNLTIKELIDKEYLAPSSTATYCKDIPIEFLEVVDVDGKFTNDLFYRMMIDSKLPNWVAKLYRTGVAFNLHWFFTGKEKIDLSKIYERGL